MSLTKDKLRICLLNLMPDKATTKSQIVNILKDGIENIDLTLITFSNNNNDTDKYFNSFKDIENKYFDGLIVTGTPLEHLSFEEVHYWKELQKVFEWSKTNVKSSLFICWASQAALYHFYDIEKELFKNKLFGVLKFKINDDRLFDNLDESIQVCHSRHSQSNQSQIVFNQNLDILSYSQEFGIDIIASKDRKHFFFNGHLEYNINTLLEEYKRDLEKKLDSVNQPLNYFKNKKNKIINNEWLTFGPVIFKNWLNNYLYN